MAYERVVATTFPAVTGVTNNTYTIDGNGTATYGPNYALDTTASWTTGDTTYATGTSGLTTTTRQFYLSNFTGKTQTWTSSNLYIVYDYMTQGDGEITQWDSSMAVTYCTDWNGTTGTFINSVDDFGSDSGGQVTGNMSNVAIALASGNITPTNYAIRFVVTGHSKSGTIPDIISAAAAYVYPYSAYIVGTYTAFSITSLNAGSYCNTGATVNIVGAGFTGATAVTIAGNSASFSVTNSTTISVTIPPMGYAQCGAGVAVAVTNGTTVSANVGYINYPGCNITSPGSGGNELASGTLVCTGVITNIANTTINWTCSGGSMSPTSTTSGNTSTWTKPTSVTNGAAYYVTATSAGNSTSYTTITKYLYNPPTAAISASTTSPLYAATNVTISTTNTNNISIQVGTTGNGSSDLVNTASTIPQNITNFAVQAGGFTTAKTYYDTAGSPVSGSYAYANVTITPQTVTMSAPTPNNQYTTVGYTRVYTAGTVGGAALTAVNWTDNTGRGNGGFLPTQGASGGAVTWTAPATPGTYTIYNTATITGTTQSSITAYVIAAPTSSIVASTTSPLYGATNVTITPTGGGSVYGIYLGTTQGGTQISTNATSGVAVGVQTGGFTTTTTYWVRVFNAAGTPVSDSSVTITALPTFTNNGPVLFNTNVTLTANFSGATPTVSPSPLVGGSWGTWVSGVGQTERVDFNRAYTLTQPSVGSASTIPQAKLGATTVSMNNVNTILNDDSNTISTNNAYFRILTGTSASTQVSFSQLRNKYLSTDYTF